MEVILNTDANLFGFKMQTSAALSFEICFTEINYS